jgi:hypothetical protein
VEKTTFRAAVFQSGGRRNDLAGDHQGQSRLGNAAWISSGLRIQFVAIICEKNIEFDLDGDWLGGQALDGTRAKQLRNHSSRPAWGRGQFEFVRYFLRGD